MTLEEYLRMAMDLGFRSFHISPRTNVDDDLAFIIQPINSTGATKVFEVKGNILTEITNPTFTMGEKL